MICDQNFGQIVVEYRLGLVHRVGVHAERNHRDGVQSGPVDLVEESHAVVLVRFGFCAQLCRQRVHDLVKVIQKRDQDTCENNILGFEIKNEMSIFLYLTVDENQG